MGGEIFRTCPDRPWGPPSLLCNGYRVFPGGKERPKGNRAFYANKALFTSKLVSRRSKLKLYWTVIRPVVVYGCETRVLKENIIQKLSVFEREILRKVFGPTKKKGGSWKIKTNIELDKLIEHRNIINYVKAQRLSWYGHIYRKPETSM